MKRVIVTAAVILATLAGVIILWELRLALVLFLFSLAIAAMFRPITSYWARRGINRVIVIGLTYLIVLAFLGGLVYLTGGQFLREIQMVTDDFANTYQSITQTWPNGTPFQQTVAEQLPPPQALYSAIAGEQGTRLIQNVIGVAQGVFSIIGQFAIVIVLSIYWTADQVRFERLLLSILPPEQRVGARAVWRSIEAGVGAYLRSELTQSLLAAALLGLGYYLMGLRYPVTLALIGALLWLIPWLGAILALILPLLTGLVVSPLLGAGAAVYTLIVLVLLEVLVEPRLYNRHRYSSLLTVVLMIALADAFGIFGLLIAPPLAAAIQITFDSILRRGTSEETARPQTQVANLQLRLERVIEQVESADPPPPPEVANLVQRLSELVREADEVFRPDGESEEPRLGLPTSSRLR